MSPRSERRAPRWWVAVALGVGCWSPASERCPEGLWAGWYLDADGDGFGDAASPLRRGGETLCLEVDATAGYAANADDCDDADPERYPGAPGVRFYFDADGDGFGDPSVVSRGCAWGLGWVDQGTDCDDADPDRFPGALWFADGDGDGWGTADVVLDACEITEPGSYVPAAGDCDDADAARSPDTIWYEDADGDGYGDGHDCVLDPDGRYVSGDGCTARCAADGRGPHPTRALGDCDPDDPRWSLVCPWIDVAVGFGATCGVRRDGQVSCWGSDAAGIVSGAPPADDLDFTTVDVGPSAACGVRSGGEVACWGAGAAAPADPTGFAAVVVGGCEGCVEDTACGLRTDGTLTCWGADGSGVVSRAPAGAFTSVAVGATAACAVRADSTVVCWGRLDGTPEPYVPPPATNGHRAVSGTGHTFCAVGVDDAVACWGNDVFDQVGEALPGPASTVQAGLRASCLLDGAGEVACWGWEAFLQEPGAPPTGPFTQLVVGSDTACARHGGGDLRCWGDDRGGATEVPASRYTVLGATSAGTCAATGTTAGCWGDPDGLPPRSWRVASVSGGGAHTCAVMPNGAVDCWGSGDGARVPADLSSDVAAVDAGDGHTCALRTDGSLRCWGTGAQGEATPPSGAGFRAVGAGAGSSCAVDASGAVGCWGVLGGAAAPTGAFVDVSVGVGACAVSTGGGVSCWGDAAMDAAAPTGAGFTDVSTSDGFACARTVGGSVECWGDQRPPPPPLADVVAVATGDGFACGLRASGAIECWGSPEGAPPGATDFVAVEAGAHHACGVHGTGEVECWGRDAEAQLDPLAGRRVVQLDGGEDFVCERFADGHVACGGSGAAGQLDVPYVAFERLSVGDHHACGVTGDGRAVCWGDGADGQTDAPAGRFTEIAAGGRHTCALDADGRVGCWGATAATAGVPAGRFTRLTAGEAHTCALDLDGRLRCWGDDRYGQSTPPGPGPYHSVYAGGWHTCGFRGVGRAARLECWGLDDQGQVGDRPDVAPQELWLGEHHGCLLDRESGLPRCWGRGLEGQLDWPLPADLGAFGPP